MEGRDHKMAKKRASKELKNRGFETETEYRLNNGMIVDVYGKTGEREVAVEVGTLHGEDRMEELKKCFDEVIHLTQFGKPNSQTSDYTTISFKKDFVRDIEEHIDDQSFSTPKEYIKHLVIRDMDSGERMTKEEIKEIGKKLKDLGYMDR